MDTMKRIEKKLIFKYVGIVFICLSIILTIISISLSFFFGAQKLNYFADENIDIEVISVKTRDGIIIKGLIFVDKDLKENDTNSIPTILVLHGINGRKEHKLDIIYQYVKLGYVVVSLEQRGHGESGSPSGFLGKEPYDMIDVIDYLEDNYDFANTTHMGLLGFSYGGGIGATLQALENRIHVSVLYHPLTSLKSLMERIPLRYLIGTTTAVPNINDIQDAVEVANETNTKNLLLIQGLSDFIIYPKDTQYFYNLVNGLNRTDIELKERAGLGHSSNEEDETSLKYAITWFEHFYHNKAIDISNLDNEITSVSLYNFTYPNNFLSENLIIASAIILFIGLSILIIKFRILPFWDDLPIKKDVDTSREGKERYKKMIIYRTTAYLGSIFVTGIIFTFLNQSFLYGYFIFFPILSAVIMLFIPSELYSDWKDEWRNWTKSNLIPFLYSVSIIIIPTIYFLIFYNLNANLTLGFTIPIFTIASLPYIIIGLGSGLADYIYLREMKGRHAMILMIIRPITILIFLIFVPLPPFPILGGLISHILFILLTGVILYYIRSLVMFLSKFYKNNFSIYLLIMLPLIIFFMRVFFRIV